MKKITLLRQGLVIVLSAIMFAGCGANKKTAASGNGYKADEYVMHENNTLRDPVSNLTWTYLDDNPTTYFRYRLESENSSLQLPSIDQLTALLDKVCFQMQQKKDKGNISTIDWFARDCDFLSSSAVKTAEGEILYEVIRWNSLTKQFIKETVTGGDLITVLLIQ
jgi:hypothetical protein